MSLAFSDTSTKKGIIQAIERIVFPGHPGKITDSSLLLKEFTAEVNTALDHAWSIILPAGGKWQLDDSNYAEDYPIIYGNLVDGQRSYPFVNDETGNLILDIYRVFVKTTSTGVYQEVFPVDVQSDRNIDDFISGQNVEGIPYRYDKTGNGIFLDPIPNANITSGLKIYINREPEYFTTNDSTKKPGFAGIFHEYLALRAAYTYARNLTLKNKTDIESDMLKMEAAMVEYYGHRERDRKKKLSPYITPHE